MKIKFFLLFVMTIPVYAQFNVSAFVGFNPQSNFIAKDNSDFLDSYWRSGIIFGLGSEIFVSRSIALSPSVEYARYGFADYEFRNYLIPEVSFISATGEPSNVWRVFLEAKFFANFTTAIPVYLTTGIGYVKEDIGVINQNFFQMWDSRTFTTNVIFKDSNFFVHTLGLGLRWRFLPNLSLDLKGQYFTNYSDRWYTSVKCGLVYSVF